MKSRVKVNKIGRKNDPCYTPLFQIGWEDIFPKLILFGPLTSVPTKWNKILQLTVKFKCVFNQNLVQLKLMRRFHEAMPEKRLELF